MSESLRKLISDYLPKLKEKLSNHQEIFKQGEFEYDPEKIEDLKNTYFKTKHEIKKIEPLLEKLSNLLHKWRKLINTLPTDEKEMEEKMLEIYDEKHKLIKTLKQADRTIDELREFNLAIKKKLTNNSESDETDISLNQALSEDEYETETTPENEGTLKEVEDFSDQIKDFKRTRNSILTDEISHDFGHSRIRLEPQKLTHFDGNYINWTSFWDDFKSSIHDNQYMAPIQKLKYLRGLLHGEPYRLISPHPITNSNYPIIIHLIKSRYGNDKLIKEHLMGELNNFRKVHDSVPELRKFILNVNRIILQLKTYNVDIEHELITQAIEINLPNNLRMRLREHRSKMSTTELLEFLDKYVQNREEIEKGDSRPNKMKGEFPQSGPKDNKKSFKFNAHHNPKYNRNQNNYSHDKQENQFPNFNRTSAFITKNSTQKEDIPVNNNDKNNSNVKQQKCAFCDFGHSSKNCRKYSDTKMRNNRARELQLCTNCLKKGHQISECTSPYQRF